MESKCPADANNASSVTDLRLIKLDEERLSEGINWSVFSSRFEYI